MTKQLIVIAALFIIQSLGSCDPCICDSKARLTTEGVDLRGLNEATYEDFSLYIRPDFKYKGIASTGLSFSSATACDCKTPQYIFNNLIVDFEIFVREGDSDNWAMVTSSFTTASGENVNEINLQKMIEEESQQYVEFLFFLENSESIPSNAVFKIELVTESETFISEELEVQFID